MARKFSNGCPEDVTRRHFGYCAPSRLSLMRAIFTGRLFEYDWENRSVFMLKRNCKIDLKTFYLILFLWLFFKRKTFDISPLIAEITHRFTASKTLLWNHNFSWQEILELMAQYSLQKFDIDSLLVYINFELQISCFTLAITLINCFHSSFQEKFQRKWKIYMEQKHIN